MSKKLFLIDGSALYYRSYFAFIRNPLINSKGENTSATFGFLSSLIKLIEDEHPDYLAVIFDTKEPTFRHEIYPQYKATREKMPEEMAQQYPRLVDTLKRLNFVVMDQEGYEADDIIGSLAKKFASPELDVYIVSGDKDMAQLVNDHVFLYNPGKGNQPAEVLDAAAVKDKMGIEPKQIVDWLALMGDSSDNIPGVPKVGKVTAVKLLNAFGSLEKLYESIDQLKEGAVKDNLVACEEQTGLARQLAAIHSDMDLAVKLEDLKFRIWDADEAEKVMNELEFRRLADRMKAIARGEGALEELSHHDESAVNYELIDTLEGVEKLARQLEQQQAFVFDLETDSLDFMQARIAGIALSWKEKEGWYIPIEHPDYHLPQDQVFELLGSVFANPKKKKIAQNIKFDAAILQRHGVEIKGLYFDTMIAAYLINPGGQHKLDKLSEKYLNYEMIHIGELIGTGRKQKKMTDIPALEVVRYAAEDADITFRLYNVLRPKIHEMGMDDLFYNLEMPLVEVLMGMEEHGVRLDTRLLRELSEKLGKQADELEQSIYRDAGEEFNLNSPQQLGPILFDKLEIHKELNLRKPPKTKTGQYSTAESILERYAAHPIIDRILSYRKLVKLKNTYLDALPQLVNPQTGRVHTSYNQTVAATGRLSSSNPNLQNIPIRTEIGREIRKAFIASDENSVILSADYSQIELRIMAHLSQDENMIESFRQNLDIHAATAAQIFDIPLDQVTSDHRRKAKEINFGIIYGMSRYGLAARLDISVDEAEEFIIDYFATYPKIKLYMEAAIKMARDKGYVETMLHRRRYLPEIKSTNRQIREFAERTAINTPIQGSAADLIKKAMIEVHRFMKNEETPAQMLLQVHDELVFEVRESAAEAFAHKVRGIMAGAFKLRVPIVVDSGIGKNWLEAHE